MIKVEQYQFPDINKLVKGGNTDVFPLINSVLLGSQRGMVFVDDKINTGIVFVLTPAGFSQVFLLGYQHLTTLVTEFINNSDHIPFYFHVYDPPEGLSELLELSGLSLNRRERQQLRYLSGKARNVPQPPEGYKLTDCMKIELERFEPFDLGLDKKFWSSGSEFRKKAYGVCIINKESKPVSICYSACIADGIAEIDIATLPDYRGRNFACIAANAFINDSLNLKVIPDWDCFTGNIASLATAVKSGFELVKKYTFLSVYNKSKHEKAGK